MALVVKNLPDNAGTHKRCGFDLWVAKIPWRRGTRSSILAWRIPWTESLVGYMKGPTQGLIVKMAIMLTSQAKNKITVILEADQIAQMTFCFLSDAYLLKALRPSDSRPPAM